MTTLLLYIGMLGFSMALTVILFLGLIKIQFI